MPRLHREQVLEIFKSRPDIFPDYEIAVIVKETQEPSSKKHLKIVALDKEKVVGYVGAFKAKDSKDSWLLDWLAVAQDYQGQGIGSLLMKKIFESLAKLKIAKLFIETCSCDGEKPARAFYSKQGYKRAAVLPNYYSQGHSKVVFLKRIS